MVMTYHEQESPYQSSNKRQKANYYTITNSGFVTISQSASTMENKNKFPVYTKQ